VEIRVRCMGGFTEDWPIVEQPVALFPLRGG
jgi:hypothetical protein